MNNRTDLLVAFAVGTVAGILLAPDRGSVTRHKIAEKAGTIFNHTKEGMKNKGQAMKDAVQVARETYREEVARPRV
jgi:gas vesicle protein